MIPATFRTHALRRICVFASTLLVIVTPAAKAQIKNPDIDTDPTSGFRRGTNTIEGQVFDSSGQPLKTRCTIRLSKVNVGELSTMTN